MKWYPHLYVGETLRDRKRRKQVIRLAEEGKWLPGVYLILLADGDRNQLEIYSMYFFSRRFSRKEAPLVIGMAFGMSEAKELLVQMTREVYQKTGGADLKSYFASGNAKKRILRGGRNRRL